METRDDMDLMLHFDGEQRLDDAATDADKLAGLADVRESVRTYLELETDAMEPKFAGMWERIERRIEANGHASDAESTRAARVAAVEETPGLFDRFKRWLGEHRGYVFTSAVTAAAVALIMLALRPTEVKPGEPTIVKVPGPTQIVKVPVEKIVRVPVRGGALPASGPAHVDSLDVSEGTSGAVLRIPGEEGETTTVIWLSPEEDEL